MPTGYTADIAKDITFEQFVWHCARAMGALIMMRDEPWDAPIPEKFEPSDYSAKRLREAQERLDWLNGLSAQEVKEEAAKAHEAALESHRRYESSKDSLRKKYWAMLEKVEEWTPPTTEHVGLKEFMVHQIRDSIKFDCHNSYEREPSAMSGVQWRADETEKALKNVKYHSEEHAKEVTRNAQRNQWIASLRTSLGSPAQNGPKP
jgi:hypothetical protein